MTLHQFAVDAGTILGALVIVALCEAYAWVRHEKARDAQEARTQAWMDEE